MIYQDIVIVIIFGCLGFFLSFLVTKVVNGGLILLMSWVSFKIIEKMGLAPDWQVLHKLANIFSDLGDTLISFLMSMMTMASTAAMVLFVLGGLTGMALNIWEKARS